MKSAKRLIEEKAGLVEGLAISAADLKSIVNASNDTFKSHTALTRDIINFIDAANDAASSDKKVKSSISASKAKISAALVIVKREIAKIEDLTTG